MMLQELFEHLTPPDPQVFHKRNDPNDPRLGDLVSFAIDDYQDAQTVILGCPQDEGVRRNKGRIGAAQAPDAIRAAFYKLAVAGLDVQRIALFDAGNTQIYDSLEATHARHQTVVEAVLGAGKNLIVLGGGNDVSYPDVSGLAARVTSLLAFNIDAHFDVRADDPRNSGTPYRQLLEDGSLRPNQFYEMAFQWFANSPSYMAYLEGKGVQMTSLDALREKGFKATFTQILSQQDVDAIFWGFDMDAVRSADAPGVSAINPTGMTGTELCQIAELAGQDPRTRLVEFTEVNPTYDIDGRTCRLTAIAMFYYLLGITRRMESA